MTYFTKVAGNSLRASQVNALLKQGIPTFASVAARNAAIPSPDDFQWASTTDTHSLFYYNGAAWVTFTSAWTNYTPSWTNLTVGSATQVAKYKYVAGGDLRVTGYITFAADTSISGTVSQTIPNSVTASATWQGGVGIGNDVGNRVYPLVIGATSTTTWAWTHAESGNGGQVNATNPFTWATGDVLTWDFTVGV